MNSQTSTTIAAAAAGITGFLAGASLHSAPPTAQTSQKPAPAISMAANQAPRTESQTIRIALTNLRQTRFME